VQTLALAIEGAVLDVKVRCEENEGSQIGNDESDHVPSSELAVAGFVKRIVVLGAVFLLSLSEQGSYSPPFAPKGHSITGVVHNLPCGSFIWPRGKIPIYFICRGGSIRISDLNWF
jgi:hypothetical protein